MRFKPIPFTQGTHPRPLTPRLLTSVHFKVGPLRRLPSKTLTMPPHTCIPKTLSPCTLPSCLGYKFEFSILSQKENVTLPRPSTPESDHLPSSSRPSTPVCMSDYVFLVSQDESPRKCTFSVRKKFLCQKKNLKRMVAVQSHMKNE